MTTELITGHEGAAHVSSADVGQYNAGVIGSGRYVLDTGAQLACEVISANQVSIGTGDAIFDGRHVRVSASENVSIDNGAQGVSRHDIICFKYEYNAGTDVESVSLAVVKGTAGTTATDPTIPSGNILESSNVAYMPLWRIVIEGITVGEPQKLFGDVLTSLYDMTTRTLTADQIPNLPASKITSGTLAADRIPNISASKITSGTLAAAQVPNLDAVKITSGTFAADRIPSLPASKIGSGTLDAARIPTLDASKIGTGTLATGRIPSLDASKIGSGTLAVARGGTGNNAFGTIYQASASADFGGDQDSYANIAYVTLPAGTYVVQGRVEFNASSGAGANSITAVIGTASANYNESRTRVWVANGNFQTLTTMDILKLTAQTAIYIRASSSVWRASSGGYIRAVRLA